MPHEKTNNILDSGSLTHFAIVNRTTLKSQGCTNICEEKEIQFKYMITCERGKILICGCHVGNINIPQSYIKYHICGFSVLANMWDFWPA